MATKKEPTGVRILDPLSDEHKELVRLWLISAHSQFDFVVRLYDTRARAMSLPGRDAAQRYNAIAASVCLDLAARLDKKWHQRRAANGRKQRRRNADGTFRK